MSDFSMLFSSSRQVESSIEVQTLLYAKKQGDNYREILQNHHHAVVMGRYIGTTFIGTDHLYYHYRSLVYIFLNRKIDIKYPYLGK